MIQKTVTKLIEAKEAYYNNEPIMTDEDFDYLEYTLRQMDPDNNYFNLVGVAPIGDKIKHQYPMLSMAKAKSVSDVEVWLKKILDERVHLIIEPKIDGLSASCIYENGKLQYIVTRGDGVEGRNISQIKDYIDIPKTISVTDRIEIRGELFIPQNSDFPNPEGKPLRNLAVGLVNRKDTGLEDLKYLKFVAYQVFGSDKETEMEKLLFIKDNNFNIVESFVAKSIEDIQTYFNDYKEHYRTVWEYETDGLIIIVNDCKLHEEINAKYTVSHHNHYAIALKPESESMWTIVNDITWQVSKSGSVIPVVNIDPVTIGGAVIRNVTANNYENVKKLKINIGDKIHVARSNDVIPYLIETIPSFDQSNLIPKLCPSCDNHLIEKGVHIVCDNPKCEEKNIQLITSWVKSCDMDQVSESTVRALYNNQYIKYIQDLYVLKAKHISLDGFGDKKITNLLAQIEKSRTMNIQQFIARLSINLVGEKAVKKLGINTIDDFFNFNDRQSVVGQNIIDYRKENEKQIENLIQYLHIEDIVSKSATKGKVCMTGSGPRGRKELIKEIEDKGYEFTDSINKETSILLCEDVNGSSSKLEKAKKLGIQLMNYSEFF